MTTETTTASARTRPVALLTKLAGAATDWMFAAHIKARTSELQSSNEAMQRREEQVEAELKQATDSLAAEVALRSRAEALLHERNTGLQRAQALARLAHVVTRPDGAFASWSESLPGLIGLAPAAMPQGTREWLGLLHPEDRHHFRSKSISAGILGKRVEVDYRLQHAAGHWVHVHQVNEPISGSADASGKTDWFCTLQDVSEQRRAEEGLRESELRFRQLTETIEDVFWISTPDFGQISYLSPAFESIWGRSCDVVYRDAASWQGTIHGDDQPRERLALANLKRDPVAFSREYRIVRPDGTVRWIMNRGFPVLSPTGAILRITGVASDITERKREEELCLRLAAIVESSDDAVIGKTLQGIITSWNRGAERLFGYPASEVVGKPLLMLIPPERSREEPEILARLARGESVDHFETVRVRKDGRRIEISATISPIRDASGIVVGASKIARDISERKLAQRRLQAQLERLHLLDQITSAIGERQDLVSIYQVAMRSIQERLPADFCCLLTHDENAPALAVASVGAHSTAQAERMGMSVGALVKIDENGLSRCLRGELVHEPDVAGSGFPFPQRMRDGGLPSLVLAPLRSESRVFGILVVARRATHAFSSGECEFLRQLSAHVALAAQQAQLYQALQRAYDELRQTQQAVMQQERLRALGQMASGIAHDINNAISPVLLYTETLLEREPGLSDRARRYLESISRSIDDVAATVARLREFYRQREPQLALLPIRLNELVDQVAELTRARWSDMPQQRGAVIRLERELGENLPPVVGIESEIREALINLVFNAVDAMPEGGTLSLRTRCDPASEEGDEALPPCVHVEVADTGSGMDEDTRRRCLEPFFTTKGERGTGLGLAMVYGIAQRHGADIQVDSNLGQGTTVRLSFPVHQSPPPTLDAATLAPTPARPLRILIIDDDPTVLQSLRATLEADGHTVTSADGGRAGISAFEACQGLAEAFDAVLTDLGMPYVDGRQVANAIKHIAADTPVIMLTGWGQRLIADDDVPLNVDRVLGKPAKPRELRAVLAELVPERGP